VVIDKVAKSVNFGPNFSFKLPLFITLSNVTSTQIYNHEASTEDSGIMQRLVDTVAAKILAETFTPPRLEYPEQG
jgi:hypothetical protein